MLSSAALALWVFLGMACAPSPSAAFLPTPHMGRLLLLSNPRVSDYSALKMALSTPKKGGGKSALGKALKKASGALTVSVEFASSEAMEEMDMILLSQQLRKAKVAAIFADSGSIQGFAGEQKSAKGNFPGPVPVVLSDVQDPDGLNRAKECGATGVLLKGGNDGLRDLLEQAAQLGLDAVVQVESGDEVAKALEMDASTLIVSGTEAESMLELKELIPKQKVVAARVDAMQAGNVEIEHGRALKEGGFQSILMASACVGDSEDLPYAKWAIEELSSKASKEFKITGMTGHVNGHFGTGTFERTTGEIAWQRHNPTDKGESEDA